MRRRTLVPWIWKIPLCGLLFFLGFIPGNQVATWLGLALPKMPAGADPALIAPLTFLASLLLAGALALVARGLSGRFLPRWLVLFAFAWVAYGVNTSLEALIFSTVIEASLYAVVLYFPASLVCAAAVAWLFPPPHPTDRWVSQIRTYFAGRTGRDWVWRLAAAFLAFPAAYFLFGNLVAPFVLPYYQQGGNQLALPGWGQLLPVVALRSALFLAVCLPVLIAWDPSKPLVWPLGLSLFLLVGGATLVQAYWLPPFLRAVHGLEILADEVIYAVALVGLLGRCRPGRPYDDHRGRTRPLQRGPLRTGGDAHGLRPRFPDGQGHGGDPGVLLDDLGWPSFPGWAKVSCVNGNQGRR